MWTDEQFEELEESELQKTLTLIAAMLLLIGETKGNIESELLRFYRKYGTDGVVTYKDVTKWVDSNDKRRRFTVLTLFLSDQFVTLNNKLETKFLELETDIFQTEFSFFDIDIPKDFTLILWGQDELSWKDRLRNDVNLWNYYCYKDVKQAILRQESIEDVLRSLDKRFLSIENVLERLGLSESSAMTTVARKEIFKELGIKQFRYYTKADERTCEQCAPLHGLVFPMSSYEVGVNAPPIHPRCRCFTIPIMD